MIIRVTMEAFWVLKDVKLLINHCGIFLELYLYFCNVLKVTFLGAFMTYKDFPRHSTKDPWETFSSLRHIFFPT